ncbi:aminoglycoside phosphotransferase family protein [Actinopolymorpha sp. B17G11]|uniref:aminoglycoside phosphotransferase family protein n=1 Tax=unclassified Actinopolymorpha TaxID=2627063 RepID=UPI0032D97400
MAEDGEILQDRSDRPVVRVGSTVRHPLQPWTPAVHALLGYLCDAGFAYAPHVVGIEGDVDILTYIEGESGPDGWAKVVDEGGLRAAARLLREYHDVVAAWRPDVEPVWFTGQRGTGGPGEVVCHGDFGPWNIVWQGVQPVGLLDWEYANLASPRQDVAYALEYMVPFRDDAECLRWLRYPEPPDRLRRLEIFAEAYGLASTEGLVDEVIAVQQAGLGTVQRLADEGHERQRELVAAGYLDELRDRIRWSEQNRRLFAP